MWGNKDIATAKAGKLGSISRSYDSQPECGTQAQTIGTANSKPCAPENIEEKLNKLLRISGSIVEYSLVIHGVVTPYGEPIPENAPTQANLAGVLDDIYYRLDHAFGKLMSTREALGA